jgi:hypothetical protein
MLPDDGSRTSFRNFGCVSENNNKNNWDEGKFPRIFLSLIQYRI